MNLPGRDTILAIPGGGAIWRALDRLALVTSETVSGTWTATDASGAGLGLSLDAPGLYMRQGRQVMASVYLTYPLTATTQDVQISGLPVRCDPAHDGVVIIGFTTTGGQLFTGYLPAGTTTMRFARTNGSALTNADVSASQLSLTALYFAA